ncbi:MAG TPA: hypothetical protein VMH22_05105 [bacterium]|nr:hypothetical protein [bacterium]
MSFHTDVPFPIVVAFNGVRDESDREAWSGNMRHRTEVSRVELRAEGPDQYEKEKAGWHRTMRGVETRVLEQGEGALGDRYFRFAGSERGRYRFTFSPYLPILDPTQTRKLTGVMEVDPYSGLPLRLYCSDSTKASEWELRLGRFNRAGSVDVPYVPAMTVDARPAIGLDRTACDRAVATINQRLARLGWDNRNRRTRSGLTLLLGQPKSRHQVEMLFSRGSVEIWQGHWANSQETSSTAGLSDSGRALEVGGDASRRVVLEYLLAGNQRINADVRTTSPVDAELAVSLAASDTARPAVLVVNNVALSAATPGRDGRVVFADIGGADDVRVIAALASSGVIPAGFRITVTP